MMFRDPSNEILQLQVCHAPSYMHMYGLSVIM